LLNEANWESSSGTKVPALFRTYTSAPNEVSLDPRTSTYWLKPVLGNIGNHRSRIVFNANLS